MAHVENAEPPRPWTTRLFDAAPVPPVVSGAALALLLLAAVGAIAWLTGDLADLRRGEPWWQNRDVRIAILIPVFLAAIATTLRYHALRTGENLEDVARLGGWRLDEIDPVRRVGEANRERRAALIGAGWVPVLALLIDRDPTVYLQDDYWYVSKVVYLSLAVALAACIAVLGRRAMRDARHFRALAERLPGIDLLDPDALAPFARQGLRSSIPGMVAISFVALNAVDQGFLWAIAVVGGLAVVGVTSAFAIPLRGIRARVHRAKQEELHRVNAAIRGEPGALQGSSIAAREHPGLADLLAYRAHVASFPEWPLDVSTLSRFALYIAIPLASWVGGALVERALDVALQ